MIFGAKMKQRKNENTYYAIADQTLDLNMRQMSMKYSSFLGNIV